MSTVTEVEPGDGSPGSAFAKVLMANGVTTEVYPVGGYLPAVGDQVPLVANGRDPIAFATRVMVDGDLQSRSFVTGEEGWRMTAAGNLEANDGYFRGRIVTGLAPDPRLEIDEIDTEFGTQWAIAYYSGDPDETEAGYMTFTPWGISMRSPIGTDLSDPHSKIDLGADLAGTDTYVNVQGQRLNLDGSEYVSLTGNDVRANDVSLLAPPLRQVYRNALATVTNSTATTIVPDSTLTHNLSWTGGASVLYDATSGAITPQVAGLWRVEVDVAWETNGAYPAQIGYRTNNTTDWWMSMVETNAFFGAGGQGSSFSKTLTFDGVTDEIRVRCRHLAGADRGISLRTVTLTRVSD